MIESTIEEAHICINQGLQPASLLGQGIWKLPPEDLQVFTYTMSSPDLQILCLAGLNTISTRTVYSKQPRSKRICSLLLSERIQ